MPSIVTENFRVKNATAFIDSISSNSVYMFLGKYDDWPNELSPPLPTDTVSNTTYEHWTDMIGAKLVGANDVLHVIPRIDWTSGTVYDEYDPNDATFFSKDFYVLTDDFNVYKCIDNNGGIASTDKPTSTNPAIFQTPDGYQWKFMYQITTADALKFLTPNHMPVRNEAANVDTDGPGATPYPYGGHGFDNIHELGASFACTTVSFEFGEGGDISTANDFRKIGLMENPYNFGTETIATATTRRQTKQLNLSAVTGSFEVDEQITSGGNTADVVEFDGDNDILYVIETTGTIADSSNIVGDTSGATATVDSHVDPELEPDSGKLIYIENKVSTQRQENQTETVSIILQF